MSVSNSLLGQDTVYPTDYSPEVLFPIARDTARLKLGNIAGVSQGVDWWHVFELSWLNAMQMPQVAIGRLHVPAHSEFIIESKSLKLYFNSLNFKIFQSEQELIATVQADLSQVAGAAVELTLLAADDLAVAQPWGECLDQHVASGLSTQPDPSLLAFDQNAVEGEYQCYSHLLRSNCPVTNQPDWGTLFIRYHGKKPCYRGLIAYIISYRQHNGFHEQCVEQIYADLWRYLQPEKLMVYATYTRRGGLDINPCRVSDLSWLPNPVRMARQ